MLLLPDINFCIHLNALLSLFLVFYENVNCVTAGDNLDHCSLTEYQMTLCYFSFSSLNLMIMNSWVDRITYLNFFRVGIHDTIDIVYYSVYFQLKIKTIFAC